MDADEPRTGADLRARPARLRRLGAGATLAAGTAMVVLSLTGLSGVDRRLEAMARDADRVSACESNKRPARAQQRSSPGGLTNNAPVRRVSRQTPDL